MHSLLFGCLNKVFAIVMSFSLQNSRSLSPASFLSPSPYCPVIFRNFLSPTFEFQSPMIINMSFLDILLMVFSNSE